MTNYRLGAGSRARCLAMTGEPRVRVARALTSLARPSGAEVKTTDRWMPQGPGAVREARLSELLDMMPGLPREELTKWWLEVPRLANTPNWDIVATCTLGRHPALLLVEAKAHAPECSDAGKRAPTTRNGERNHERITKAIGEANAGLSKLGEGWGLSQDHHYQLSNRFAWAWKLASLGVPAVLVYLGFLSAEEMGSHMFATEGDWKKCVLDHARGVVPETVWGRALDIGGTPLWPLIVARSVQRTK